MIRILSLLILFESCFLFEGLGNGVFINTSYDTTGVKSIIDSGHTFKREGKYLKAGETFLIAADIYQGHKLWADHVRSMANAADNYRRVGKFTEAEELINTAISSAIKYLTRPHPQLANAYHTLGIIKDYQGLYNEAIAINNQALGINLELGNEPLAVANIYNSLGVNYLHKSDNYRSIENFKKALEIFLRELEPRNQRIADLYLNMGGTYLSMDKYDLAKEYFEQEMSITMKNMGPNHPYVGETCNNLGTAHAYLGNSQQSKSYFLRSLEIFTSQFGKWDYRNIDVYHNLGLLNSQEGDFDQALYYFDQLERAILTHLDAKNVEMGRLYLSVSLNSLDMKKPEKAQVEADNALEIFLANLGPRSPMVAKCYIAKARGARDLGDIDKALQYCQQGLIANTSEFADLNITANPTDLQTLSHKEFLRLLEIKAGLFHQKYLESSSENDLQLSFKTLILADQLIAKIQQDQLSFADKLHQATNTNEIYILGVKVSHALYDLTNEQHYLQKAFNFSDRSKAAVLRAALATDHAEEFGNVPPELLQLEAKLNADRNLYENEIQDEKTKGKAGDTVKISGFQDRLFTLNRAHDSLVLALESQFPEYFKLKYQHEDLSIEKLQLLINRGSILEYFYTDTELYCFVITREQFNLVNLSLPSEFTELVEEFRNKISSRNGNTQASGQKLYDLLIAPVEHLIVPEKRLTIIPHGILALIPFDVLSKAPGSTEQGSTNSEFLVENHPINYIFSAGAIKEESNVGLPNNPRFAGFAPGYQPDLLVQASELEAYGSLRDDLGNLFFTNDEIAKAASYFPQPLTFSGEEATESMFKSVCGNYDILHLALHAVVDQKDPLKSKLIFTNLYKDSINDGFLTAREIYNLKLGANMAILSACNTAFGKLVGGEGVMSLGRAFAYAGCPSVIMSLWPAQDQATAVIMGSFYDGLSDGLAKDQAMRQAKLEYLENADDLLKHPFYWANFIVQGNTDPINRSTNPLPWILTTLLLMAILVIAVVRRKERFLK